jgi:tRNA pseudouridine55 synthase
MDGILLVNKPKGWTSFDVVAKVRGTLKKGGVSKPKVGHTGTLDPMATGLLVLLLGNYTKKATELSKLDKVYEAILKFGFNSSTGDMEGTKTKISTHQPTEQDVQTALEQFIGQISQIPPAYSAVKVDGQRAYKLARAGKEVKIEPRNVTIYTLEMTDYKYPLLKITTRVSSGTYIRTLAEDIGQKLGTGAYLTNLNRTKVGQFDIKNAIELENITAGVIQSSVSE